MEEKKIKTIFGLLLTMIFLAACSLPASAPTAAPQGTQMEPPPTGAATEPAITPEGGMPVTGEGLCANAYYPVRQGATWNYKSTGSAAGEYSFTDTISSVREDGFTLSTQFGDVARTQEWACRPEGLAALQFGGAPAAMLDAQNMQLNLQVSNVSGVTFPSQIKAGDTWQHNLDLQGNMTVAGQEGTATGNAQTSFTALGNESVTVPAGTFDALKIQVDTALNMNVTYQSLSVPVAFTTSYTYWFTQGVGWVKNSGTGSAAGTSFSETTELQSYSIP
ncbi:MAG: hypothetical protein EHM40_11750 [Chloroflexi bacterium]|nr:MAG: hypothetical protein EHM40_11750 [Chloroflexota bacterium]